MHGSPQGKYCLYHGTGVVSACRYCGAAVPASVHEPNRGRSLSVQDIRIGSKSWREHVTESWCSSPSGANCSSRVHLQPLQLSLGLSYVLFMCFTVQYCRVRVHLVVHEPAQCLCPSLYPKAYTQATPRPPFPASAYDLPHPHLPMLLFSFGRRCQRLRYQADWALQKTP